MLLGKRPSLWTRLKACWMHSLLTVSAVLLLTSAVGKTVSYGLSANAQVVVHQVTRVPKSLALAVVLAELMMVASLTVGWGSRRLQCSLLFLLCSCFLSYRVLNWGGGPCGCYVNPALLNARTTQALELFAWASLLYMLLGSALALLATEPPATTRS